MFIQVAALVIALATMCGMVHRWLCTRLWLYCVPSLLWLAHAAIVLSYELLGFQPTNMWRIALVLHGVIVQAMYFVYPEIANGK